MFRLTILYLLMFFLNLPTGTMAMGWFNEHIPRKELVTPIIDFEVSLLEKSPQARAFKFIYAGEYSAKLIMYGTKANQPPRAKSLAVRDFSLRGIVEIRNSNGVFFSSPFKTIVGSTQTGAYLMSFEVDKKYVDEESVFSVSFDLDDQDILLYFDLDKTRLYVRKELKHSFFD